MMLVMTMSNKYYERAHITMAVFSNFFLASSFTRLVRIAAPFFLRVPTFGPVAAGLLEAGRASLEGPQPATDRLEDLCGQGFGAPWLKAFQTRAPILCDHL